jgi:PKD repeat protein
MATYYVDFKNGQDNAAGTSGAPFKTPDKAHAVCASGDTIKIRGSKTDKTTHYPDKFTVTKSNTTWEADAGHKPTWDGGYTYTFGVPSSYGLGNSRPGSLYNKMLTVSANGVTLRGLRVQNIGGGGFGVGDTSSNVVLDGCESDTTYGASLDVGGVSPNSSTNGLEVKNCTLINSSFGFNDPVLQAQNPNGQKAANAVMLKFANNVHIHHTTVAYTFKEGINIDKTSKGTIVEYCTIHSINHSAIYINRATDCHVRYNVIYHIKRKEFLGSSWDKQTSPSSIKIGDEGNPDNPNCKPCTYPNSSQQRIYGNLVIGGSSCITVANNATNYDTILDRAYIGYNTLIGEVWNDGRAQPSRTKRVIEILQNEHGKHHKNTIFENNLIYAPPGVPLGTFNDVGGITFRNNLWYSADGDTVPAAVRSSGDITGNPLLANPDFDFTDVWPAANGGVNINYYQLGAASPAIGRASDRSAANGITPPPVAVDLTGTARTDLDRPNMRYYDIGALERGDGGGTPTGTVTANFTQSGTGGVKPYTVTFTNTSSDTGSANINSYLWEWGDGTTSDSAAGSVQKTYSAAGSYQPRLTVRDTNLGLAHTKIGTMIVVTAPPVADGVTANFTQSGTGGQAPYTVTFTDTSTAQGAAVIHTRNWNFGDGESAAATGVTIQHTYSAAGSYTPTLTVRDAALDLIDTKIGSIITVTAPPVTDGVVANFTQSGTAGQAPYIVTFTNTSTTQGAAVINEWEMRFGDGNVGYNTPFPITYIYSQAGTFTPRLIVRDTARGLSDARNGAAVTVTAPPTGEEPGVMDVARLQLPTVTGDKTIQLNLGGVAPALALFILNKATAMGVAADGAMLSLGATDGVRQWCSAFNANDNLATSKTEKLYSQAACIVTLHDGAVTGRAVLKSVAENQVTLTISDAFPANYYLTVIAFGGPNFRGAVNTFALGVQTSTTTLNPGWRPELWLFGGNAATAFDAVETQGDFAIGLATETEGGALRGATCTIWPRRNRRPSL